MTRPFLARLIPEHDYRPGQRVLDAFLGDRPLLPARSMAELHGFAKASNPARAYTDRQRSAALTTVANVVAGPANQKYLLIDGKYRLNPNYNPPFDITLGQAITIPPLLGAGAAVAPAVAAAAGAISRFIRYGGELNISPNLRIAPFGNRAGHRTGRFPHYHRRPSERLPNGEVRPGQGFKRHRPWDKNEKLDRNWRDRF